MDSFPLDEIIANLKDIPAVAIQDALRVLKKNPSAAGLKAFYSQLMLAEDAPKIVKMAVDYCSRFPDNKAHQLVLDLAKRYPGDRGVIAPLYLRYVELKPGEAMYLQAGRLHAYLSGAAMEIMADSDNVVRGGITRKHIDIPALLKILSFAHESLVILTPQGSNTDFFKTYQSPAREFELSLAQITTWQVWQSPREREIEILFCTCGEVEISGLKLMAGESCLIPVPMETYEVKGEHFTLYRATVAPTRP